MRTVPSIESTPSVSARANARRKGLRAALALFALATFFVQAPAMAQQVKKNWMREYVQLRVAEKNLESMPAKFTASDLDAIFTPSIVGGTVAGAADNQFQVALLSKSGAKNFDAKL